MSILTILEPTFTFLPADFSAHSWKDIQPFYDNLTSRELNTEGDLKKWISDRNELGEALYEESTWRYIRMTTDTTNVAFRQAYEDFVSIIDPPMRQAENALDKKFLDCPFAAGLDVKDFFNYYRDTHTQTSIYREENLSLITEMQLKEQQYGAIAGAMTVMQEGKELTMHAASKLLYENNRVLREGIYMKMLERRLKDKDKLNTLYDELVSLRNKIAHNAGEANYRDYKFKQLRRYDYTTADCFRFHEAIHESFVPAVHDVMAHRKAALKLDMLRPWDLSVDINNEAPAQPFKDGEDLWHKTVEVLGKVDPYFADCLTTMHTLKHLDLDSRKGKAPGGYNCSLPVTGVPFIFMNAAGTANDVITMVHESGHAVHSFLARQIPLQLHKEVPSEVAELASMSMELFTMQHWDTFYSDPKELKRAQVSQLERVMDIFPWVAVIDAFQHWVYENPNHTHEERKKNWIAIFDKYHPDQDLLSWEGLDDAKAFMWQKQLHVFEVPFYYIEYAMAQLGAIALWKIYKEDNAKALAGYKKALALGYTCPIDQVYAAAGIRFDFSNDYVKELATFVKNEWKALIGA